VATPCPERHTSKITIYGWSTRLNAVGLALLEAPAALWELLQ
jgi:hypothetical protein